MANRAKLTFPITKRTPQDDGTLMVEGPVTDESLDLDGQIVDAKSAAKAIKGWFDEHANIHQQHSPLLYPAGKAVDLSFVDGTPWVKAWIIDPTAVKLTKAGVYDSFSIGIADGELDTSPAATKRAPMGILYPSLVNEISIVSYPANIGMGKFSVAKRRKDGVIKDVQELRAPKQFRDLEGDSLVEAMKSALEGLIVHTAASPAEARSLIGTQFSASDYEARGDVIVVKRSFDANVGGGVDRDKIPTEDFAGKDRSFPIVKPGDVSDAASSIGRAGDDNYDSATLKTNIISIAKRKGPEFVAELPKEWRNEMSKSQKAKKAPGTEDGKPFDGAAKPFGKKDGETPEEKAERKAAKKAAKAMSDDEKGDAPNGDEKPDETKPDEDSKGDTPDGGDEKDDTDAKGDGDMDEKAMKKKTKKAAKKAAKAAKAESDAKEMETMSAMKMAHDVLCPLYKGSFKKSLNAVVDVIDPEFFRQRLLGTSEDARETRYARKGAYDAASQIATLEVKSLATLQRLAHKSFTDAYPDVKVASPDLSDPASFQRGFLPSATKEQASSTSKPGNFPDSAKPLSPEMFMRGPLTQNESRQSLVGGTPAKDMVAMTKSRNFYTNAAKDKNENAMSTLHDHIVDNYPSVCPAGSGMADESGDRLGTPAEMYAPAPGTKAIDTKGDSSLEMVPAGDLVSATKRATEQALKPFRKEAKKQAKRIRKLQKSLSQPDYSKSAHRVTEFAPTHGGITDITDAKKERLAVVKSLTSRVQDRHSGSSTEDLMELQDLLTPEEYAAMMTADEK